MEIIWRDTIFFLFTEVDEIGARTNRKRITDDRGSRMWKFQCFYSNWNFSHIIIRYLFVAKNKKRNNRWSFEKNSFLVLNLTVYREQPSSR